MTWHDRLVHGLTSDGHAIVRYNRAGKWYIEPPRGSDARRRPVTVAAAAAEAANGTHYPNRPGGTRFDALVRNALTENR